MAMTGGGIPIVTPLSVPPEGDGSDGDYVIRAFTTLTRDYQFRNLTVNVDLNPNGFRVRVSNVLKIVGPSGSIEADGGSGQAGTDGGAGGAGGGGGGHPGGNGGVPATSAPQFGLDGSTHGAGGDGGAGAGGGAGSGNSLGGNGDTGTGHQGASGGGGGSSVAVNGGGGGGGGGYVGIICNLLSGSGKVTAKGGNGGSGNANNTGGGGGGAGGRVIIHYRSLSNWTGTVDVSGGTGGAGAGAGFGGTGGGAGEAITAQLPIIANPGTAGATVDLGMAAPDDWLHSVSEYNLLQGGLATEDRTMDVILLHPQCIRYLQEHGSEIIEHDYPCPCGRKHNIKLVWRDDLG